MGRMLRPEIGDVLEMRLGDGRYAYAQYVFWDERKGPLVQVFSRVTEQQAAVDELRGTEPMFPPVLVGLWHAVRTGRWKVVGSLPVENFRYPLFRTGIPNKDGRVDVWWLRDGTTETRIGALPEEYRALELLMGWSPLLLEERIQAGGSDPIAARWTDGKP
jgi:hypothetical protein